jgi:phospholipid/cholesterol/gamma-HCH transport system ATP-binding protein
VIEFHDIHKSFGEKQVLRGVNVTVERGKVMYIIGTSGAGKSVLVKHLVGLIRPDKGRIILDDEEITHLSEKAFFRIRKKCAMVFQHATLFDSMSLLDNVAFPLRKHQKMTRAEAHKAAMAKLEMVHVDKDADLFPGDVGAGLQKRVAIARALTLKPEFVIFDEPTTGLDPLAAANVDELIRSLRNDAGVTSIVVSHDLRSIFTVADRIAMIYKGHIRLDGDTQEWMDSKDPIVRQFIRGEPDGPLEI